MHGSPAHAVNSNASMRPHVGLELGPLLDEGGVVVGEPGAFLAGRVDDDGVLRRGGGD